MLNELLQLERGVRAAKIETIARHPSIKDARNMPTLLVLLDANGHVSAVRLVPRNVTPWTLRDGQHNSFPFVQPKLPFWTFPQDNELLEEVLDRNGAFRRQGLLKLSEVAQLSHDAQESWSGAVFLRRLEERRTEINSTKHGEAAVLDATLRHFILACGRVDGGRPVLLREVLEQLITALRQSTQEELVDAAVSLLIGEKKKSEWLCAGALLFDSIGFSKPIYDVKLIPVVTDALLKEKRQQGSNERRGTCALTGAIDTRLLTGNSSQPNLPGLGQTYLYSKNKDIPANDRYGQFAVDAMPMSEDMEMRMAAALEAVTADDLKNKTWRMIPGEAPKQSDLLIAFVASAAEAPCAEVLAGGDEGPEHSSEVANDDTSNANSVAAFEKLTERFLESIRGRDSGNYLRTPIQIAIIRKLDPGNRKVIYADAITVGDFYSAAQMWKSGERNVPEWLALPIFLKGQRFPQQTSPPHVSPLGLIGFSKRIYIRGGTEQQEATGLTASEALRLLLRSSPARTKLILSQVLRRRGELVKGIAHTLRKGLSEAKGFDRFEVLRTVTVICLLLHKLGREKETYMNQAAFKLGQLLAAADVVHVGYCADVRGGDVPPSLLGNQVFTMAQATPTKALATLCRRWKPYAGWVSTTPHKKGKREQIQALVDSKKKDESQRGWEIRKALRHGRDVAPLSAELASLLEGCHVDDVFRAELLLGYMAGLPPSKRNEAETDFDETNQED